MSVPCCCGLRNENLLLEVIYLRNDVRMLPLGSGSRSWSGSAGSRCSGQSFPGHKPGVSWPSGTLAAPVWSLCGSWANLEGEIRRWGGRCSAAGEQVPPGLRVGSPARPQPVGAATLTSAFHPQVPAHLPEPPGLFAQLFWGPGVLRSPDSPGRGEPARPKLLGGFAALAVSQVSP